MHIIMLNQACFLLLITEDLLNVKESIRACHPNSLYCWASLFTGPHARVFKMCM